MAIWLVRAGSHGEFEQKFIQENRVYATWDTLDVDMAGLTDRSDLVDALTARYPSKKLKTIVNWSGQLWPFAHEMKKGDLVVLPLKTQPAVQVGEVNGAYTFSSQGPSPFYHWRSVKWVGEAVPRGRFGKDLLFSFGAFMTICRIQRNNAEVRLAAMRASNWKAEKIAPATKPPDPTATESGETTDVEELARDSIAQLISARFKGHALTRLVEGILRAQGYTTYLSPEGADGGADILAGAGPLGFGAPKLCVEVKSEETPTERSAVDKLLGAVTKFGANEGLFVAWGGFKSTVQKELAPSFFRVRLWTQKEFLEELFAHYDELDDDLKAELPLKRIWTVATQAEEE